MEAKKYDSGKPDVTLVPTHMIEAIAKVMEFGSKKYGRDNWRSGNGLEHHRVLAAALRHIYKFMRHEELDPESGMNHLWHAATNLAFLIEYQHENLGLDDLKAKDSSKLVIDEANQEPLIEN